MTSEQTVNDDARDETPADMADRVSNTACIDLLDKVFDEATRGNLVSVALVMVPKQGTYRITAVGPHVEGLLEGAKDLANQLDSIVSQATSKLIVPQ